MLFFGLALSVVQLALGVIVGVWCVRRRRVVRLAEVHAREHHRAATRLLEWTQKVADDVHSHNDTIGNVRDQLACVDDQHGIGDVTESRVTGIIQHLSLANESLQARLDEAETTLQHQAAEFQAQLSEARTDALTGLANRRSFDEQLAARFAEWTRYGHNASLILLDVDRFKDLNDHHGHLAGDAVLRQLADVLAQGRDTDVAMRYGGEEFAVLLPHTDVAGAEIAAERIRTDIAQHTFSHEATELPITVSYGLAQFTPGDELAESIVARADSALYASKLACRNNGHVHDGHRCLPIRPDDEELGHERRLAEVADASAVLREGIEQLVGNPL